MRLRSRALPRRGIVALALVAGLLLVPAGVAGAAKGPGNAKVPPEVIARVAALQKVFGGFSIDPTAGPIGTTITFTGQCGFPADDVSLVLEIWTEPTFNSIIALRQRVPIPWSAFGSFSLTLTVPATGLDGEPVQAGTYSAGAACNLLQPTLRDLGSRPFEVTPSIGS